MNPGVVRVAGNCCCCERSDWLAFSSGRRIGKTTCNEAIGENCGRTTDNPEVVFRPTAPMDNSGLLGKGGALKTRESAEQRNAVELLRTFLREQKRGEDFRFDSGARKPTTPLDFFDTRATAECSIIGLQSALEHNIESSLGVSQTIPK